VSSSPDPDLPPTVGDGGGEALWIDVGVDDVETLQLGNVTTWVADEVGGATSAIASHGDELPDEGIQLVRTPDAGRVPLVGREDADLTREEIVRGVERRVPVAFCDHANPLGLHDLRSVGARGHSFVEVMLGDFALLGDRLVCLVSEECRYLCPLGAVSGFPVEDLQDIAYVAGTQCNDGMEIVRRKLETVEAVVDQDDGAQSDRVVPGVVDLCSTALKGRDDLREGFSSLKPSLLQVPQKPPRGFLQRSRLGAEHPGEVGLLPQIEEVPQKCRGFVEGDRSESRSSRPRLDVGTAEDVVFGEACADEGLAQFVHRSVEQLSHDLSPILLGSPWFLGRWR